MQLKQTVWGAEAAQAKADAEAAQAAANAAEEHVTVAESTAPSCKREQLPHKNPKAKLPTVRFAAVETAPVVTAPTVTEPPASQGKTVTVSATAYSRHEAGLSTLPPQASTFRSIRWSSLVEPFP